MVSAGLPFSVLALCSGLDQLRILDSDNLLVVVVAILLERAGVGRRAGFISDPIVADSGCT